jgi:ribonuclease HI
VVLEAAAMQEAALKTAYICIGEGQKRWMVSPNLHALLKAKNHLGPELTWRIADILSWGLVPELQPAGESRMPSGWSWDPQNDWGLDEDDQPVDPGFAREVSAPAWVPRRGRFDSGPYVHVQFDGGAAKGGIATAGYLIVDSTGAEVVRRGVPLGRGLTNNDAESSAVRMALEDLDARQRVGVPHLDAPIRVLGDSQMIIRLLLGIFKKARKPSLYLCVEGVRALAKQRKWRIAFRYVPRQLNSVADDMCRRAEAAGAVVEYLDGALPPDAPRVDLEELYQVVDGLAAGTRGVCFVGSMRPMEP